MIGNLRLRLRELRALQLSSVKLCKSLDYRGWEHLHETSGKPRFFLLAPVGSSRLARRVLDDFLESAEGLTLLSPSGNTVDASLFGKDTRCASDPARRALEQQAHAHWILTLPRHRRRWDVHFLPAVFPREEDTVDSLTRRYLNTFEECWRDLSE